MGHRRLLRRAVLAAAATATVGPIDIADAATVTCGQQVTASITVDNDLTNCPGKGLVVAADGLTIDLNGHTLDGDEPADPTDFASDGVDVGDHHGVTVRNGRITGFADGVQLGSATGSASRNVVTELTFAGTFFGVREEPGDHNIIAFNRDVRVTLNGGGRTEVAFNDGGSVDASSDGNRVERNTLRSIRVSGGGTYVGSNTVTPFGLSLNGDRATAEFNTIIGADFGIGVFGSGHVVRRNLILASRFYGIYLAGPYVRTPPRPVPTGNVFLNNTVSRGSGDGIVVERQICDARGACSEAAVGTLLRHNRTRYNAGGDGIRVNAPQTTLARNIARHNGDIGIEAVAGVTDGGENRAAFNGGPAQCVGVVCRP